MKVTGKELDEFGLTQERSVFFWYPYGKGKSMPHPDVCCGVVPFFKTDEIDYKELFLEVLSHLIFIEPEKLKAILLPGFNYVNVEYDGWQEIEADNEFFRKLMWSVFLHISAKSEENHYDRVYLFDTHFMTEEETNIELVETSFHWTMAEKELGYPHVTYDEHFKSMLPAFLEMYL